MLCSRALQSCSAVVLRCLCGRAQVRCSAVVLCSRALQSCSGVVLCSRAQVRCSDAVLCGRAQVRCSAVVLGGSSAMRSRIKSMKVSMAVRGGFFEKLITQFVDFIDKIYPKYIFQSATKFPCIPRRALYLWQKSKTLSMSRHLPRPALILCHDVAQTLQHPGVVVAARWCRRNRLHDFCDEIKEMEKGHHEKPPDEQPRSVW